MRLAPSELHASADRARPAAAEPHPGRLQGHVALVVVQLCFGLFPVFGKQAFAEGGFEPRAVACWRILVGALALSAFALWRHSRALVPPRADLARIALCALLGVVLNQGLYLEGLERSDAVHAGLLMCLIPVFTFVLAAAARQESFEWARALGVLLALVGALPLLLARGADHLALGADRFLLSTGTLLLVSNALCYSAFLVLSKALAARHSPWLVIAWVYLFSLPGALWFGASAPLLPADPASTRAWTSLAAILVFATVIGYALNIFALSRVRASTTAVYIYLQPLLTALGAVLFLGESLTRASWLAGVLMFAGIALVSRRRVVRG